MKISDWFGDITSLADLAVTTNITIHAYLMFHPLGDYVIYTNQSTLKFYCAMFKQPELSVEK